MTSPLKADPLLGLNPRWVVLLIVGLAAVSAGSVLPQLLAPPTPAAAKGAEEGTTPDTPVYTPPAWPESPSPRSMLLRLVGGTAFVLVLCLGSLWVARRWLVVPPKAVAGTQQLSLVETLPLGNRCCVHLLKVGNQQVLVGADGAGLKTMVALTPAFEDSLAELRRETLSFPTGEDEDLWREGEPA